VKATVQLNKKTGALLLSIFVISATSISTLIFLLPNSDDNIDTNHENVEDWLEDFDALCNFVQGNYPYLKLKNRTHGYNWLDLKPMFVNRIKKADNDTEFLCILLEAVEALQNRHTYLMNPRYYSLYQSSYSNMPYPFNEMFANDVINASTYWTSIYDECINDSYYTKYDALIVYERGEYVIVNSENHLYDEYRVVAVNGIPIDEAVKQCYIHDYLDWDFQRNKHFLWMISPRDFGTDSLFALQDSSCRRIAMSFNTTTGSSFYPYNYPSERYETQILENDRVAYLYMSTFMWDDIESDISGIVDFLQQVEDYDYLIIDIRGNLGGNYRSWIEVLVKPLIHEESVFEAYLGYRTSDYSDSVREAFGIVNEVSKSEFEYLPTEVYGPEFKIYNYQHTFTPSFEVNFDGVIILLVDHVVYSAAEGFTSFCKQTEFAIIYGTASGGDGIMEFPNHFVLPNSKLVINLSSALGLDHNGYASEEVRTQPDVIYDSAFGNFTELIDYVLTNLP
jgi:hypothetical protein